MTDAEELIMESQTDEALKTTLNTRLEAMVGEWQAKRDGALKGFAVKEVDEVEGIKTYAPPKAPKLMSSTTTAHGGYRLHRPFPKEHRNIEETGRSLDLTTADAHPGGLMMQGQKEVIPATLSAPACRPRTASAHRARSHGDFRTLHDVDEGSLNRTTWRSLPDGST